jgi:hypothetical protein
VKVLVTTGLVMTFAGCLGEGNQTSVLVDDQALEITGGTSFGMCAGYCVTELRIDSVSATFVERSQALDQPDRSRTLPLTRSEWERFQALVDTAAARSLQGVHGCPDCADGGAEWIQIETEDPIRITYEYGAELDGIQSLQAQIRELRDRFPR